MDWINVFYKNREEHCVCTVRGMGMMIDLVGTVVQYGMIIVIDRFGRDVFTKSNIYKYK